MTDVELDNLVAAVLRSRKYRTVAPALIRRIGALELAKRPRRKEAIKATKNKLHQIAGAYWQSIPDYEAMLALLRETAVFPAAFRASCRQVMAAHRSTAERLPILDDFYTTILAEVGPLHSVLDLACGLNPLTYPWLPGAAGMHFTTGDIYTDLMAFNQHFLALAGLSGEAVVADIGGGLPTVPFDLVLILKTLPVLEQVEKGAATRLLDRVNGRYLLITFPARSLGGRRKGMVANYEAQFEEWMNGRGWSWRRFEFVTELAFLVDCQPEDKSTDYADFAD